MCESNHVDKFMPHTRSSRGHGKKFITAHPLATMTSGFIVLWLGVDTAWYKYYEMEVQTSLPIAKRDWKTSEISPTSVDGGTPVLDSHDPQGCTHYGLTVCMRRRNLLQTLELRNSSSRASRLKAFGRFNGKRAAPSSSASSSVILATSNIHAHGLQV